MRFSEYWLLIKAIPKTLYFNFKYFSFKQAIKLPILVSHSVYLMETNGKVIAKNPKLFGVKIGFGQVGIFDKAKSRSIWQVNGTVVFNGKANIGHGSKISVGGELEFGHDFVITAESSIVCNKRIAFGEGVTVSWENLFMDTDYHHIYNTEGHKTNEDKDIIIGDHVWIGCRCTILKGAEIGPNNVIAANSIITRKVQETNSVIGGMPVKAIKTNISWAR